MRKWLNRQSGAIEFSATISSDILTYLDLRVKPYIESDFVSLEDLHARFNHLPYAALSRLNRDGSITGMPDRLSRAGMRLYIHKENRVQCMSYIWPLYKNPRSSRVLSS